MPGYVLEELGAGSASEIAEGEPRATDRASEFRQNAAEDIRRHAGPEIAADFLAVLDAYDAVASSARGRLPSRELDALAGSLQQLNAGLKQKNEPFFVDSMRDPATGLLLISYYIAGQTTVHAEGATFRLIRVQRLDAVNRAPALVGYTRAQLNTAIVLLDMVERQLVDMVIPALSPGGSPELVDTDSMQLEPAWASALHTRAGEILREDLSSSRFSDPNALLRLVSGLTRRQVLFRSSGLALQRRRAASAARLLTGANVDALDGKVPRSLLREWKQIEEDLGSESIRRAFGELIAKFALFVDRHEMQHQIDFRRGLIPVPAELRDLLGAPETVDLPASSAAVRCRDELSAILASVASAREMPKTALTIAVEPFFNRTLWSTPHAFAAAVILDGLAHQLGDIPAAPIASPMGFDRRAATQIYLAVVRHSPDRTRHCGAKVMGAPLRSALSDATR